MKKQIVGKVVTFTFEDNVPAVSFDCALLSRQNAEYAVPFGMGHRLGDNAAIQKCKENNFTVTEAMRRAAIVELIEHYQSGSIEWSPKAKAKTPAINPTWAAIAEKRGMTYEAYVAERVAKDLAELEALGS